MKKLLFIFTLSLFASASYAQYTSVITGSGSNESSMGKSKQIINKTEADLAIIETEANNWNIDITKSNDQLVATKNSLKQVLDDVAQQNENYRLSETDPGVKDFSTKHVPTCFGSTPRLTYQSNNWVCKATVDCDDLNPNQTDWVKDPATGKCLKPAATWETKNWSGCSSNRQTRTVRCKAVSGSTYFNDDACVGPKPLASRSC